MALINDIYVFVESENVARDITASTHPVETGVDLTDSVRQSPLILRLSGELVGRDYEEDIAELEHYQKNGELVEYTGINMVSDVLITKLTTDHTSGIRCGCSFSMELQEIRIASSPFTEGSGSVAEQQVEEACVPAASVPVRTHTVKRGDTLSGIAKVYYGNASQFMKIFEANRDKLSDPNKIKDGQVLTIP